MIDPPFLVLLFIGFAALYAAYIVNKRKERKERMTVDYPGAIEYLVDRARVFANQNSHSAIVVHGTGGSAEQTVEGLGEWFRTNGSMVSSHFGIGRDGRVAQYVLLQDGAAANCCLEAGYDPYWDRLGSANLNVHTVSIECINDRDNSLPLTAAQKAALFKLVKWLCERYNLTAEQVKTHASIAPGSRARCPGQAFPLEELKQCLKGETIVQLYGPGPGSDFARYFVDQKDGSWRCQHNGAIIFGGNLELYRQLSIDGRTLPVVGLPKENEQYLSDGYSIQRCERATIIYDKEKRHGSQPGLGESYLAHVPQETQQLQLDCNTLSLKVAELLDEIEVLKAGLRTIQKTAEPLI